MELLIIVLLTCIILDIAALLWGVDSTDRIDSPEWKRKHRRGSFL